MGNPHKNLIDGGDQREDGINTGQSLVFLLGITIDLIPNQAFDGSIEI
jgi:hypothetical protein